MVPEHATLEAACCWVRAVRDDCGELLAETRGYFVVICVGLVLEFYRLIGGSGRFLVGEPGDEFPETSGICFVGTALDPLHPDSPRMGSDLRGDALFQVRQAWVEAVPFSRPVSLRHECLGCV